MVDRGDKTPTCVPGVGVQRTYQSRTCPPARVPSLHTLPCKALPDPSAVGGFCSFLLHAPHPWPLGILAAATGLKAPTPRWFLASQSPLCPSTPRWGAGGAAVKLRTTVARCIHGRETVKLGCCCGGGKGISLELTGYLHTGEAFLILTQLESCSPPAESQGGPHSPPVAGSGAERLPAPRSLEATHSRAWRLSPPCWVRRSDPGASEVQRWGATEVESGL